MQLDSIFIPSASIIKGHSALFTTYLNSSTDFSQVPRPQPIKTPVDFCSSLDISSKFLFRYIG